MTENAKPKHDREIQHGYHVLLSELRENCSLSDRIDREGLSAVLAGGDPAITASALQKANKEFVTDPEKSAERILRDQISERFPAHTLTGEELPAQAGAAQWIWSIDPVDGTSAMIRAAIAAAYGLPLPTPKPAFGISIGLLHDDTAAFGVIAELLPHGDTLLLGRVWVGGVDTPATCDGRPVPIAAARSLGESVLACTVPEVMFCTADRWAGFQALAEPPPPSAQIRTVSVSWAYWTALWISLASAICCCQTPQPSCQSCRALASW